MRQVIINIEDDDWNEYDIAYEVREVGYAIKNSQAHGGITGSGNIWSIE